MMQRKTRLLAAGAVAVLAAGALAGIASADMDGGGWGGMYRMWGEGHGRGMMGQQMMERYDTDKDGKITQAEIDQNRTAWHGEFDADKNASLSLEEFRALWLKARGEMIVREFQFFDSDGNGQVTLEEYQEPLSGLVASRDRNGDGVLSREDRGRRGMGHRWRDGDEDGMGESMGKGIRRGMGGGQGDDPEELEEEQAPANP